MVVDVNEIVEDFEKEAKELGIEEYTIQIEFRPNIRCSLFNTRWSARYGDTNSVAYNIYYRSERLKKLDAGLQNKKGCL
jgi:hypothetical protein